METESEVHFFKAGLLTEGLNTITCDVSTCRSVEAAFPNQRVLFRHADEVWRAAETPSDPPPRGTLGRVTGVIVRLSEKRVKEEIELEVLRPPPLSARVADKVARVVGSWKFVIGQALFLALWLGLNAAYPWAWDAPPYLFLNLLISFQAAFTGPTIMVSQNRQSDRDHRKARELHDKVDQLRLVELRDIGQRLVALNDKCARAIGTAERAEGGHVTRRHGNGGNGGGNNNKGGAETETATAGEGDAPSSSHTSLMRGRATLDVDLGPADSFSDSSLSGDSR